MVAMDNKSEEKIPVSRRPKASKKKRRHKPKDFPKRPLSAYNIFFKETRLEMLEQKEREVGRDNVDFQSMVKEIASRWKSLPPGGRDRVEDMAKTDLRRYKDEVRAYEDQKVERSRRERQEAAQRRKEEDNDKASMTDARARKQLEDEKHAAEHMARASQYDAAGAGIFSVLAQQPESAESALAEHQMILAQEIRKLDAARELKGRQLQLAQLQAGVGSGSSFVSSLQHPAGACAPGLSSLSADRLELEMLRRQVGMVPGGSLSLGSRAPLGDYGLPADFAPRMAAYPPLQVAYDTGQDAALLQERRYTLQEQELLADQLGRPMVSAPDPMLGGYPVPGVALSSDYFGATKVSGHPGLSYEPPYSTYPRSY